MFEWYECIMNEKKRKIFMMFGVLFFVLYMGFGEIPNDKLEVSFLDVGQGDSIYIKTPSNNKILVDGGPRNYVLKELSNVIPFFDKTIDLVVLTHPHDDHLQGLNEVVKRYKIGAVMMTGAAFDTEAYKEFLRLIKEKNIPVIIAEAGKDFSFGDVDFDVLYPFKSVAGNSFENINNSSIAIKLIYKNAEVYLGGDGEKEVENELVSFAAPLKSSIYKASHHGSRTASTPQFLSEVSPKIAVIQVGKNNTFKHPHPETLRNFVRQKIEKVYRTDKDGTIKITFE
ncbi:MAG: ComEC/Rec2 family competence protein [Candidatus Gracilibacteria bacterium]|jgi:competence protein ComEC